MTTLPDLDRRLSRRIETGKGIQLSPDDLDLLVSTGAYEIFRKDVVDPQREQRSEEHTSELHSLLRNHYPVLPFKQQKPNPQTITHTPPLLPHPPHPSLYPPQHPHH